MAIAWGMVSEVDAWLSHTRASMCEDFPPFPLLSVPIAQPIALKILEIINLEERLWFRFESPWSSFLSLRVCTQTEPHAWGSHEESSSSLDVQEAKRAGEGPSPKISSKSLLLVISPPNSATGWWLSCTLAHGLVEEGAFQMEIKAHDYLRVWIPDSIWSSRKTGRR